MSDERLKHTVVYKSGVTVDFLAANLTVKKVGSTVKSVEWSGDIHPRPLHFGVDDVAAVWVHDS
jgi:hypothetical protein